MKKVAVFLLTALTLGACSKDAVSPTDVSAELDDAAMLAYSASFIGDPGANFLTVMPGLPENIRLTAEQQTQIRALLDAFAQNTKADRDALAAIMKQARQAAAAGQTREQVRAILAQGLTYRQNLQAAEQKLHDDIWLVLTAEQKAWIQAHRPGRCNAPPLTEDQKNQISALFATFAEDNQADIAAIRVAHDQARLLIRTGATREEVRAVLEAVRPAMLRVRAAELVLHASIRALLTPEQLAARCGLAGGLNRAGLPTLPPMGPMGGMGGH